MEFAGVLDYIVGFAVMAGIYSVMALGLNVQWGFTGLFNIGIAGFFALGAYTSALLTGPPHRDSSKTTFLAETGRKPPAWPWGLTCGFSSASPRPCCPAPPSRW